MLRVTAKGDILMRADSGGRGHLRSVWFLAVIAAVPLCLVCAWFGVRQWALWELRAWNAPLTPWLRSYVTWTSDHRVNETLAERTEYTTWGEVSTETHIMWSEKGIGAAKYLIGRIDRLLEERARLTPEPRSDARVDVRLFRLFLALDLMLEKSGTGLTIGGLYTGPLEKKEAFIERYKGVRSELLKGANGDGQHALRAETGR